MSNQNQKPIYLIANVVHQVGEQAFNLKEHGVSESGDLNEALNNAIQGVYWKYAHKDYPLREIANEDATTEWEQGFWLNGETTMYINGHLLISYEDYKVACEIL